MQKSPDAFRTISEVAEALDVPAHVLRFWESKFPQIRPVKRGGGRRYYRPDDVSLLKGIRELLYTDGLTIKGVQKVLREGGVKGMVETNRNVIARGPAAGPAVGPVAEPAAGPVAEPAGGPAPRRPAPEPEPLQLHRRVDAPPKKAAPGELREIIHALEALRDRMKQ
jgi:DNA-binding transcriptional MerR regulator